MDVARRAMVKYSTPKKHGQVVDLLTIDQVSKVFGAVQ